jgi:uncharacterized protein YbjT (DUF2867 family)
MSREHFRKVDEMIANAFQVCEPFLPPAVAAGLRSHWIKWIRDMRYYYADLRDQPSSFRRRLYQVGQLLYGTAAARSEIIGQLSGKPKWAEIAPTEIRRWLESLGLGPVIAPAT